MPNSRHPERRRADRELSFLRRWGQRLVVSYLLLLSVAIVAVWSLQSRTDHLTRRLEVSQYESCHRLNLVRAGANASAFASWQFFELTARLVRTSTTRPKPAAVAFADRLDGYANELTWIPLTRSCRAAATGHIVAPSPIKFTVAQPPSSALHVGPGE